MRRLKVTSDFLQEHIKWYSYLTQKKNTLKKSSEFDNFTKKCIYSIAIYKACLENLNHKEQFFAYCFLSGIKGLGVAERGNVMVIKG